MSASKDQVSAMQSLKKSGYTHEEILAWMLTHHANKGLTAKDVEKAFKRKPKAKFIAGVVKKAKEGR